MDFKKITSMFTVFGDFKALIDTKEASLDHAFSDYKKETIQERFLNNLSGTCLKYSNQNMVIAIHVNRIDFQYGYVNPLCNDERFTNATVNVFYQIQELYPSFAGNRIALNENGFFADPEKDEMDKLSNVLGFVSLFEQDCMELQFRVNLATQIHNEIFNSVVTLQDGNVKENRTGVSTKAVIIANDINTLAKNDTYRFKASDVENYITNMIFEAEARKQQILSKLE